MSPLKAGWPQIIPKQSTKALATHATMKQVTAGEGKVSGHNMKSIIMAMMEVQNGKGNSWPIMHGGGPVLEDNRMVMII